MGSVPLVETWSDGDKWTYDLLNERVATPLNFLQNPPRATVVRESGALFITSGSANAIAWTSFEADTDNMWSSAQPTRLTPKTPGWYVGSISVAFGNSATPVGGGRAVYANQNGDVTTGPWMGYHRFPSTGTAGKRMNHGIPVFGYFNGTTDYCEVNIIQTSGSNMSVYHRDGGVTRFTLKWFAA